MSWGHDEYMYLVAKGNNTTLPPAGLFIIRVHSIYALHRSGSYTYLMNDEDKEMMSGSKCSTNMTCIAKASTSLRNSSGERKGEGNKAL
ncbi:hypothetical protein POUND7_010617 [Theobroma cacao]